ncbi:ribonuclease E inhibitor RraB [Modestobacter sp. VKM Ac-2985]|uniref:ribonuclease E inhibitor RraB n=1 Tax=Modestobacter sp. VKM Ac-2985 TaxID=3004139 RepID=UPI0022AB98ED|nr:ribonuclease E inhibitor RraB [Modestobacter sp. VKM Ac-2985]MCZ2838901.1 ribonuclease E inhibitor RraB [Modestobacter sp. VKM Ac-2985]
MRSDLGSQLRRTTETVEANLGHGDQVHAPRPIDHLAGFRSRSAATAAGEELTAAGYRVDGLYRRLRTVWLEFSAMTAVDHGTADAFTREIVGIVDRHGGRYDGWGGFLVPPDGSGEPDTSSTS